MFDSLPSLSLGDNQLCGLNLPFGQGSYNTQSISKIAEALKTNSTLQSLEYAPARPQFYC